MFAVAISRYIFIFPSFLFSRYRFADHYKYLSAWFEKMNLPKKIFLVTHDWGVIFGFHWANQHQDRVAGIAFMEAGVGAFPNLDWLTEEMKLTFQVFSLLFFFFTTKTHNRVHKEVNVSVLICIRVYIIEQLNAKYMYIHQP